MGRFESEKHLKPLLVGIAVLLLFICFWAAGSYQQKLNQLDRRISATENELVQFKAALREFRDLEESLRKLSPGKGRANQKNLISTVEEATEVIGARSQLAYVRPQPDKTLDDLVEEGAEIKFEKLQLSQLVQLLYRFEQTIPPLKVAQLRVRTRFENPEQLDASMLLKRFRGKR